MSKEEKEAVKQYVQTQKKGVSEYVRDLVLNEIKYNSPSITIKLIYAQRNYRIQCSLC